MVRIIKPQSSKAGKMPGSLVHLGERKVSQVRVHVVEFDEQSLAERLVRTVAGCRPREGFAGVTWTHVSGLHDAKLVEEVGAAFGIHALVLEDVLNTAQRAKYEDRQDMLFVVVKRVHVVSAGDDIGSEHIAVVLGPNWVVSFQENEEDVFADVRQRLAASVGRIRGAGADYLAYTLIDTIVDRYYAVLEYLDEQIETMHERVMHETGMGPLQRIQSLRRQMVYLRKMLWPLRETISSLHASISTLIRDQTRPYLHDVYEHTIQVMENVEALRDMLTGAFEIHLSLVSNRMNDVMRTLTVIATIFIPLTFVAGIYGMNFQNMPELGWSFGYVFAWSLMLGIAIGMLVYFHKRKWL